MIGVRRPRQHGQSMVEFALILPLIMLLLLGLVEFGFLLYAHVQLSNSAREAARAASLYRANRYAAIPENRAGNPPSCATNLDGWSMQQVINAAIVNYGVNSTGCPNTSGTIISTSLGTLPPLPADGNMWTATLDPAFTPANATAMPAAGTRSTLILRYPYRPVLLADLFPFLEDPVWIEKAVTFEFSQ